METDDLARAAEELIAYSTEDVVLQPQVAHGRELRGHDELRKFWADFAEEGLEMRAGIYSITEEGNSVIVSGWMRMIDDGRLADTQSRWVYRFDDDDRVVSARVERA